MSGNWLRYANQGATRNLPLSGELTRAMSFLPDLGVQMEVFSGGQPAKGSGGARVGSERHDHGDAADVRFYKDGRQLSWANPADVPLFQEIVSRASERGLTGFGAGDGYMGEGTMHLGFGNKAVWGAGGKGSNAPDWLREAASGHFVGDGHDHSSQAAMAQYPSGQSSGYAGQNQLAAAQENPQFKMQNTLLDAADFMNQRPQNQLMATGYGENSNPFLNILRGA